MGQASHIVKLVVAWTAAFAAALCLWLQPNLVLPLGVVSLAFSNLPE